MWNSLGSLRDRVRENAKAVRENAKAAAQVAQEVLVAAAAEDDDPSYSTQPTADDDQQQEWDRLEQQRQNGLQQGTAFFVTPPLPDEGPVPLPPPPPPPLREDALNPPPPPPDGPPPPPPEDTLGDLRMAVPPMPTKKRASRYVEAGLTQAEVPVAAPPRPSAAIFQPPPLPDANGDEMKAPPPAEQLAAVPPPLAEPPAESEPPQMEGGASDWGDNWGLFAEPQEATEEEEVQQQPFGWSLSSGEQTVTETAIGVETPTHVFGLRQTPAEQSKTDDVLNGQEHQRIMNGHVTEEQQEGATPAAKTAGECSGGADGEGNIPAQAEIADNGDNWTVPAQDETNASAEAWNIPGQDQAGSNAGEMFPVENKEVTGGEEGLNSPAPIPAGVNADSMILAGTEVTASGDHDWNIPNENQTEGSGIVAIADEDWKVDQTNANENAVEPFGWGQSDAGQSSANDAAVDWFSGQSVQPETSDPTQSEVSASEDLFGSHTDSTQQREEQRTLPAPEPLNFNADEWSSSGQNINLDSSVSDSAAVDTYANGAVFADQVDDSNDREADQKPDRVMSESFETGTTTGNADAFWTVVPNTNNDVRAQPAPQSSGVTSADVPREEPSGTNSAFTPTFYAADHSAEMIAKLQEEIQGLKLERDSSNSAKEASDRSIDELKRSLFQLKDDLATRTEDFQALTGERDDLLRERDQLADEKLQVERERDAAAEQGGDGIREARGVIEVMRSGQDIAEKREAIITEQIQALRLDLDCISGERNALLTEADELRSKLKEEESGSRYKEEELRRQLRIAENEKEIALLEREKALTASQLHVQEHKELLESEQSNASALAAYQSRVRELEDAMDSLHRERHEELLRLEAFSTQMEDMKERTRSVIEERNDLYDHKLELQKEIEGYVTQDEQAKRELMDAKREHTSLSSEREEARQRYANLRDQLKDSSRQLEAVSVERDRLLQDRTATATGSSSISENGKSLAAECQRKTAQVATLQRKLTAAAAKIEKLTLQRGTFQRQRDEAGARLRAAGSEFAMLNAKLQSSSESRDILQNELVAMRDERDSAMGRVQELSEIASQKKVVDENLESTSKQLEDVRGDIDRARDEVTKLNESKSVLQQKYADMVTEMNTAQGRFEIAARERDILRSQHETIEEEKKSLQQIMKERENAIIEAAKHQKSLEAELSTTKEKAALDVGIARAELAAEEKIRSEQAEKLKEVQTSVEEHRKTIVQLRETVVSSLRSGKRDLEKGGNVLANLLTWPAVDRVFESDDVSRTTEDIASASSEILVKLCAEPVKYSNDLETVRVENSEYMQRLEADDASNAELVAKDEEIAAAEATSKQLARELDVLGENKRTVDIRCQTLEESIAVSEERIVDLEAQLQNVTQQMKDEIERGAQISSEERKRLLQEVDKVTSNLKSIWAMLQKSLASQQVEMDTDSAGDYDEMLESENVAVLALRATASIVAELERNRAASEDTAQRLATAEVEVARLVDRAEIAEQERDAYKGTNERLERKASGAFAEGEAAAKTRFEAGIAHIEYDLKETREELRRVSEKAARSEKEAGELRALCSKLTAQFNGRTNELDEAEEKVVYLQDQVTNLEEDLEEAHRRLKVLEEESTEARRSDVDRLTAELQEAMQLVDTLEKECARLREAYDVAENSARESELLSETHRKAEENLQIAIEQLEAAQESAVEQRTIELQKKVQEAEQHCERALKREEGVAMTENKLSIRDEEIKELRGAVGRLADERVELKLELEKSLSRLNHPDAGGQLVDRRVVRQLLVSYFRVGSIRRRDVLELMSRMLAFSDGDNVAVGLKRRALMDRIGSLVQPPELDNASLPPLGTVSDKWIEFLMNETEEGEEQAKGW